NRGYNRIGLESGPGKMDFDAGLLSLCGKLLQKFREVCDGLVLSRGNFPGQGVEIDSRESGCPRSSVSGGEVIERGAKKVVPEGVFEVPSVCFNVMRRCYHR